MDGVEQLSRQLALGADPPLYASVDPRVARCSLSGGASQNAEAAELSSLSEHHRLDADPLYEVCKSRIVIDVVGNEKFRRALGVAKSSQTR